MQIVLVEPQIPQNTGSIARTCAAMRIPLHLIEPMGFEISEKAVRRAGLDYWPHVDLTRHQNWDSFTTACNPERVWLFTTKASRPLYDADFREGDSLVFGSETAGLTESLKNSYPEASQLRIPIDCKEVRSLNLSNAVSIVLYEALRQTHGW